MPSSAFYAQRSRVAILSRHRDADDPELADARLRMKQERLIDVVESALAKAPPVTPEVRDRIMDLLQNAEAAAAA